MAQLNSSNVSNGNIVESNDILQLYDAFTAGGGTTGAYNVSISGSLTGSATSASYALSASFVTSASFALSASSVTSASFAISSSRSVSASFATNATNATNATIAAALTSSQVMPNGSGPESRTLRVAAGSLTMTGSLATTPASDDLKSKTLGTTLFVTATPFNSPAIVSIRSYSSGTGQIQFQTVSGSGTEFITWTAFYVPS